MIALSTQTTMPTTYLAECLHSLRKFKRIEEELKAFKKKYPAQYQREQIKKFAELLEKANNALLELLQQEDFRDYIRSKIYSERFLLLVKADRTIHVGPRLALTQTEPSNFKLTMCRADPSSESLIYIQFSEDTEFTTELCACCEPEYLVHLIVDTLGEP